ncbi:GtrA family protein [Vibrio marisflavi]|uniref:GtrA/DPMS transmembrane domain-containing protein n=1 Tax=Vibrio marisflavi CECT 7928 TaxID=634439 RepID=A0ABM9A3U7_9VIBR|nr:GtrA family protein [Vibrio marisflavi]CAH0539484.1 hypothetical protein VMF7928_02179 [Vibrio marisflavi CECT 7928]
MFSQKIMKFAMVGGLGFVVDTIVFSLAIYVLRTDLLTARVVSFILAATTTWLGNRLFTFSEREKEDKIKQWSKFFFSALISAMPNFAVFQVTIYFLGSSGLAPFIALVLGVLTGMFSNFTLSHLWVFNEKNIETKASY